MPDGFAGAWLQTPSDERAAFQALCRMDPVFFARNVLGINLWSRQREIVRSVRDNPRTAVKSCHASGKSFTAAVVVLWFLYSHPDSIVATTAPTFRQVEKVLWAEVRSLMKRALARGYPLPGRLYGTEIKVADKWFAFGFSTDNPDRFQGLHAPYILVVLDEASGIPVDMWGGIEGVISGGHARLLSIGNPTDPTAQFAVEFASLPAKARFTISAFDTPNLKAGRTIVPGLVTPDWVEDKKKRWGEKSPLYQSRVLGDFPTQAIDTLIPLSWIERAQQRWEETPDGPTVELGVDVAYQGDDMTVFALRRGDRVSVILEANGLDTQETAGRAKAAIREHGVTSAKIDVIGFGAGVYDRLAEDRLPAHRMYASNGSRDPEKFANARAEWFWDLRERFEDGRIALDPEDTETAHELSMLKYRFPGGRILIEDKAAMKARIRRSPDRADAVMLAFATPFAAPDAPMVGGVPIAMPQW